jgi:Tfp pilus assembly protein PilF
MKATHPLIAVCLAVLAAGASQAQFVRAPNPEITREGEPRKTETVRPEVGRPLQTAQELMKAQHHADALAKIAETDAVPNKTAFELLTIARMRGAAAMSAGNAALAIASFESVLASGQLSSVEQLKLLQAMASVAYRAKDYGKAASFAQRYVKEGGSDVQMRTLLIQSHYLGGAYAEAAKELQLALHAEEAGGRTPTEDQLQLLASCYAKQNDAAGYQGALEKLVTYHPKKDYWADLLRRVPQRTGFASRLSLDVYRLQLATGTLVTATDYVEMTQLAMQESSAVEARKIIDRGFAAGVLGSGPDADRHKRLRDLAAKAVVEEQRSLANADAEAASAAASPNGIGLFNLGWTLFHQGQLDKGLAMMELGLRKGGLKRPEDARLHLGVAAWQASQKSKATQLLKAVQGQDGTAELARLWLAQARADGAEGKKSP